MFAVCHNQCRKHSNHGKRCSGQMRIKRIFFDNIQNAMIHGVVVASGCGDASLHEGTGNLVRVKVKMTEAKYTAK